MEHITQEISKYAIGGFSVVPALAWNDLIRGLFNKIVTPDFGSTILAKLIYALVITLIAWLIVRFFGKIVTFISSL